VENVFSYANVSCTICRHSVYFTLQQVLTHYLEANRKLKEEIVLYYALEMFKLLEALDQAGIVHGNISLETLILLDEEIDQSNWDRWQSGGWKEKGLVLVNFQKSVDRRLSPCETQIDYYCVCDVLHWLLHGTSMEVYKSTATNLWKPKKAFLRSEFNAKELWEEIFSRLLNSHVVESQQRSPVPFKELASKVEAYLTSNERYIADIKHSLYKHSSLIEDDTC
jgi:checkpoint serine/threonine-protein kinase